MEIQDIHKSAKNSKWLAMMSGFIGGSLPTVAILYAMTQVPPDQFELPHFNFFLGLFIMGSLGMFIVAISSEKNAYKAFPLGGGAPSFLNTAGTVAAVGGGNTVTSFLEHIGAVAVSTVMLVSPNVQAQTDSVQDSVAIKDSITVVIEVKTEEFYNMIIGTDSYPLKDSTQIKIPKVDFVRIGNLESYKKYKIPQKELIHIDIVHARRPPPRKGKRHFMQAIFTQQVRRKKECKFKVVIR